MITVPSYAKLNLTLEILGKYPDGYHQITSVMQTIELHDTLSFKLEEAIQLECNVTSLVFPNNLVLKAAELLKKTTGVNKGVHISLEKRIPMASGLGGGSSNAAITMQALNELWGLQLSPNYIKQLAPKLGSDVAFFLEGGTALVSGRGEEVVPLPPFPQSWIVILKPQISIPNKTATMYGNLKPSHFTNGRHTKEMVASIKGSSNNLARICYNAFEQVAFKQFDELEKCKQHFLNAGASKVHLAGAGPVIFAIMKDRAQAEQVYYELSATQEVYLTHTL